MYKSPDYENNDDAAVGFLSYLTLTEDDAFARLKAERDAREYLIEQGVLESTVEKDAVPFQEIVFYDSLDAMLMGLTSGEVSALSVPDCTARYLCAANDQVEQLILYHPDKAEGFTQDLLPVLSNGYSFMMLEENSELRDHAGGIHLRFDFRILCGRFLRSLFFLALIQDDIEVEV